MLILPAFLAFINFSRPEQVDDKEDGDLMTRRDGIMPKQTDAQGSAARFGFDKGSLKLRIEWSE
ncbi:MAG: hypothetical protein C4574_02330 [Candidatus Latescibacterota bacterium]|jgi:hypothetical protein|nr:MAG: hypothetical protein C4574_02330 [Candidatus Latescibacterota bacterium]